ncbi:CD302 antigen [Phyllobates terribilis]|uniref:CD302 antigen n=1 Tax=Phyllobates terribilis TaxID=111132 RepID=UPI003CCA8F61
MLPYVAMEVRTALLICLSSAFCCVSGHSVPAQEGDACPSPLWVQLHSSCYTFVHVTEKNSLSVGSARELCKDIGADIISISSQEENSFLVKVFQNKWKGPTEVLLGMFYDSDDNSLKWYDKSDVTFFNWRQVQSADYNLNTCVKMNTQSGRWDVTDCDKFRESAVLCKYISKESVTIDRKAMKITVIATFTIITLALPIAVILLHKRRNWSNRLQSAEEVLPYSDDAVLVDTMEREDCLKLTDLSQC